MTTRQLKLFMFTTTFMCLLLVMGTAITLSLQRPVDKADTTRQACQTITNSEQDAKCQAVQSKYNTEYLCMAADNPLNANHKFGCWVEVKQ